MITEFLRQCSIGFAIALMPFQAFATLPENVYSPSITYERSVTTIRVEGDGSSDRLYEHTKRIESDTGISNHGEATLSYSNSKETIEIIEASITQPDGTVHVLGEEDIHDKADSVSDGTAAFSDTHYKVIVYPRVQIGSRLHYKARIKQHTPDYPGHFTHHEFFLPWVRHEHEETILEVSKKLQIKLDYLGGHLERLEDKDGYIRYRYLYQQDSAVPMESGQIDYQDYSPYFMASSFKNHVELGRAYQQRAKPMAAVTPEIRRIADEITHGVKDEREQVRLLYHWVASNIRYVYLGLGDGGLVPQPADLVLKNRYGDCKGHVVLLEALLAAKGIESSPALINSGGLYQLPTIAVHHPFNHVISYIPSLELYLDSTAQLTPFGHLPAWTMDKPVILTALDRTGRTPTLTADDHVMKSTVRMRMLPDGSIEGTSETTSTGWLEDDQRQSHFNSMSVLHREVKYRLESYRESGDGKIVATSPQDFSKPFSERTTFALAPVSNIPGPAALRIPAGPLPYSLYDFVIEKPKPESRIPITCFSHTQEEVFSIELPDGVQIQHLPKDTRFENTVSSYQASYKKVGNTIMAIRKLRLDFKDFVCDKPEKQQLAELIDIMRRDLRGQIVYQ